MKKKLYNLLKKTFLLFGLCTFAFSSCTNDLGKNSTSEDFSKRKSQISYNIGKMKEAGLFDSLISSARSASDEEEEMMLRFINDTDSVLEEIALEENGQEKIEVINALFCGASTEEFANSFAKLDAQKAEEYLTYVNENLNHENQLNARTALSTSIKLSYASDLEVNAARSIYAADLEWSTIGWYTGFCAATVAGCYMASYGGLWTRIAGYVAATAGAGSMVIQLSIWSTCSDIIKLASALINKDLTTIENILNSEEGYKLGIISAETVATAVACYFTPLGQKIVGFFKAAYNKVIDVILDVLPKGINYVICGIPIKRL